MKRIWELISTASHSRTTALLVILVIGAAIPLTVFVAQKQQEVRQQASGGTLSLEACAFAIGAVCIPDTLNLQPGAVSFRLHWNIRDDTNSFQNPNCIASGGWNGTKTVADIGGGLLGHNEVLPVPSTTTTYRLDCIGLGARALNDSVTVVPSSGGGGDTCTDADYGPWNDAGCGNGGAFKDCNVNEMYQTRSIASGKGCNLNTRDMEQCVPNSTCGSGQPPPVVGGGTCQLKTCGEQVGLACTCNADGSNGSCETAIADVKSKSISDCISPVAALYMCMGDDASSAQQKAIAKCQSGTPTPACDTGIECTGACTAPSNTCGANNGTESGCQFTALTSGGTCNRASAPDRSCAIDKCASPNTCSSGQCADSTEPPPPTGIRVNINYTIGLDGIGSTGDRVNPGASSLSNKNPRIKGIGTALFVSGEHLASGTVIYDASSGKYTETVTDFLWSSTPGTFVVKIGAYKHLTKIVYPSISVSDGQTIDIVADLVAGDINDDNQLSVLDYNMLLSCFGFDFGITDHNPRCWNTGVDLNDDNIVDQVDYNLWLREFKAGPREGD